MSKLRIYPSIVKITGDESLLDKYDNGEWILEPKYDGAHIYITEDTVHNKKGGEFDRRKGIFSIKIQDKKIKDFVIDAEFVARTRDSKYTEDVVYAYDILWLNGRNLVKELDYLERRKILKDILPKIKCGYNMRIADIFKSDFKKMYKEFQSNQIIEGVVLKRWADLKEFSLFKPVESRKMIRIKWRICRT